MQNNIKAQVKGSGRYDEIMSKLFKIILDAGTTGTIPVDPFKNKNGETLWRVNSIDVVNEAIKFTKFLKSNPIEKYPAWEDFENLNQVIRTEVEMYMHNCANKIAHRKNYSEDDMEYIRTLLVLQYSIEELNDPENFRVPKGWKISKEEE